MKEMWRKKLRGSEIQSILFKRPIWTASKAKEWAKKHDLNYGKVDLPKDGRYVRLRQQNPKKFKRFRIKEVGDNIKFIFGFN